MSKVYMIGLFSVFVASTYAASQLAPLFQAIAHDPRAAETMDVDLSKADPFEEVPSMIAAVNSGNRAVMDAAVRGAIAILQIHKMDWENPRFRKLRPSLPEVIKAFQPLVSTLSAHFADAEPELSGALSNEESKNTPWRTHIVQFLDLAGEAPTPDMVAWMLKVVRWPDGPAQEYVARIEKNSLTPKSEVDAMHDSFLRGVRDHFRSYALNIAPVLAHLHPMPDAALHALMSRIEDSTEPLVAVAIIKGLTENKEPPAEIVDQLVPKALDKEAALDVRVAAIYAFAKLRPTDRSRLSGLRGLADERIARALVDTGVR